MKIGIMGGSFHPIHMGHLMMSEYIRSTLDIRKVIFIPTGTPPHKQEFTVEGDHRLSMVELATLHNPHFFVSDIEIKRKGTSYSVDTVRELMKIYPEDEFYFFLGSDIILDLKGWKKFDKLAQYTKFVVAIRPGFEKITLEKIEEEVAYLSETYGAEFQIMETPRYEISSTDLRSRIRNNKSVNYLIPESVIHYINKHHLYEEIHDED